MKISKKIMQVDMFRYFLMYKYGGLYVDMDYRFLKKYDLLDYKVVLPISRDDPICLSNCIMASEPNHPFWKILMDTLFTTNRTGNFDKKNSVLISTGPKFVTEMWKKYQNKEDIFLPKKNLFNPLSTKDNIKTTIEKKISYGIHLCTGTWLKNKFGHIYLEI